jgi:transposase
VSARTALVNAARGLVKSYGERLRKCDTQQVRREATSGLSTGLREALEPLLREVESLNGRIQEYDRRIEKMAKQTYPETALLKQLKGVGDLIATTYVLTLEDAHRFRKSRDAGCFVGLQPGRRNSGESEPQMRVSKEGDEYLLPRDLLMRLAITKIYFPSCLIASSSAASWPICKSFAEKKGTRMSGGTPFPSNALPSAVK